MQHGVVRVASAAEKVVGHADPADVIGVDFIGMYQQKTVAIWLFSLCTHD